MDGLIDRNYANLEKAQGGMMMPSGSYQPATRRQQLEQAREALVARLAKMEAAIKALDENPNLEAFIDTLQQAGL